MNLNNVQEGNRNVYGNWNDLWISIVVELPISSERWDDLVVTLLQSQQVATLFVGPVGIFCLLNNLLRPVSAVEHMVASSFHAYTFTITASELALKASGQLQQIFLLRTL